MISMSSMLKLIQYNFFHKPPTRLYPKEIRKPFERTRGKIVFNNENCIYCGLCARKCPADAIIVNRATKTWQLNAFRCIVCSECVSSCPKKSITLSNERRSADTQKPIIKFTKI